MKVGFLSVERTTVDVREAKIAMFDSGHTADAFLTVGAEEIDRAVTYLRTFCDAIVIDGNTAAFYDTYKDTLSSRPEHFELDGKLHSVVREVTPEFLTERFLPLVNKKTKKRYATIVFKTYRKSESELRILLKDYLTKKSKVQIGFFPDFMECEVHARCLTSMAQEDMTAVSQKLDKILGGFTYAYERISLEECVSQMLREEGLKLKIAESFTGGAIGAALTKLPGASEFLMEDVVTYSVASKNKRLGVPLEVIAEKGAVSGDTAYNMAYGLMSSGDCDIAIATTGNAGPSSQNGTVGLCYIALGLTWQKRVGVFKYLFDGDRECNIASGVKNALLLVYSGILDCKKQARLQAQQQPPQQPAVNPTAVPATPDNFDNF
ncbi:MAG: nicotinamide-nucleotide amidohydrolase family protein [Clostridia bacterium]|nr:nicotinamide-nucleotide amidohydrolase family protein [Clostridia bacterium]